METKDSHLPLFDKNSKREWKMVGRKTNTSNPFYITKEMEEELKKNNPNFPTKPFYYQPVE